MENSTAECEKLITKPLLDDDHDASAGKGGFKTMPFILANESTFEQVASYGLHPNMILYLTRDYHLNMATGSNKLYLWSAATNFMPLLGAIVADSFVGRFRIDGCEIVI
ncbi:unnamed protein product [Coffea canephora]|uniref:Uncharacterized protein n=1 Tax=Coffea canephora TaxID=49390 RepID=A0A068V6Q8_COFCA|nr:unnamed protein product [Coffea canephora]